MADIVQQGIGKRREGRTGAGDYVVHPQRVGETGVRGGRIDYRCQPVLGHPPEPLEEGVVHQWQQLIRYEYFPVDRIPEILTLVKNIWGRVITV